MNQLNELQKRWEGTIRSRGILVSMRLERDGLKAGAATILAKREADGVLALDGNEGRLLTLLSAAYGQPIGPSLLSTLRKASSLAQSGDEAKAAMLVAL